MLVRLKSNCSRWDYHAQIIQLEVDLLFEAYVLVRAELALAFCACTTVPALGIDPREAGKNQGRQGINTKYNVMFRTEKSSMFSSFAVQSVCCFLTCCVCDVIGQPDEGPVAPS